jgi:hypothetical protein
MYSLQKLDLVGTTTFCENRVLLFMTFLQIFNQKKHFLGMIRVIGDEVITLDKNPTHSYLTISQNCQE